MQNLYYKYKYKDKDKNRSKLPPAKKKPARPKSADLYWLECFVMVLDSLVVTDKALFGIKAGQWGNYTA